MAPPCNVSGTVTSVLFNTENAPVLWMTLHYVSFFLLWLSISQRLLTACHTHSPTNLWLWLVERDHQCWLTFHVAFVSSLTKFRLHFTSHSIQFPDLCHATRKTTLSSISGAFSFQSKVGQCNLVFFAQSTIAVISGQKKLDENKQTKNTKSRHTFCKIWHIHHWWISPKMDNLKKKNPQHIRLECIQL